MDAFRIVTVSMRAMIPYQSRIRGRLDIISQQIIRSISDGSWINPLADYARGLVFQVQVDETDDCYKNQKHFR